MKLYIVATPIGNLNDITLRALEILRSVDLIMAEDTRKTRILLARFDIDTPVTSFHHHTSPEKVQAMIREILAGKDVALVTDAGTPGVSDPGNILVSEAAATGIEVSPVPGPSAVTALLAVAGIDTNQFIFGGFLPKKKGRQKTLTALKQAVLSLKYPLVFFESPERILKLLTEIKNYFGEDAQVIIGRELTKLHEEIIRGTVAEVLEKGITQKGEMVVLVKNRA